VCQDVRGVWEEEEEEELCDLVHSATKNPKP